MDTITVKVDDFGAPEITRVLKGTKGVVGVDIDLSERVATVTYDETELDAARIQSLVARSIDG